MVPRRTQSGDYELADYTTDSDDFDLDGADFQAARPITTSYSSNHTIGDRIRSFISILPRRRIRRRTYQQLPHAQDSRKGRSRRRRKCLFWLYLGLGVVTAIILLDSIFNPSYTQLPEHYRQLQEGAAISDKDGPANPHQLKVFIAASLYDKDGQLLRGAWGNAVLELIALLGKRNVFLSVYENDSNEAAAVALAAFKDDVPCRHSLVHDKDFIMEDVRHVELPDGSRRVKRISFLAEVRNKALQPLEDEAADIQFDKILYLNDVIFKPIEAVQLLLSTNRGKDGTASYRAACAVDFINPFKFYDTFASRDAEGFGMGVPFFPWFTSSGEGISRHDVLLGKDAVRVKSCWGGMVAFDASPFQAASPLRFRASEDLYWDASECCLIHADLVSNDTAKEDRDHGIYMNPYVRVAYSERTLYWLQYTRRFEKLYAWPHSIINGLVGLPWFNPRRAERAGSKVDERVWVPNSNLDTGGSFQMQEKNAKGDGFCGRRGLQLLKEGVREGEKNWEDMPVPSS